MRDIPPTLKQHLGKGATTLCNLWTLTLRNGTVMGFTNHDRDMRIKGINYLADTGVTGGAVNSRLGFSVDNGSVLGVFRDDRITIADIDAGLYAGARLHHALINWADPSQRLDMSTGFIGEISRQGDSFTFEWLGETARLDRTTGRVFSTQCDAEFGDARCGLDADNFPDGTTCPRSFSACHTQFSNSRNFRGFPFLIGDDALTAAPRETDGRDGGSRYGDIAGQ